MYIVLEGIKGSGKSTQFGLLQQWLQQHHPDVPLLCPTAAERLTGRTGQDQKPRAISELPAGSATRL